MQIEKLRPDLEKYLDRYCLGEKYQKQKALFETNPKHPSLHREKLHPRELNLYSFRIDRKYRAIFGIKNETTIEIVHFSNHYSD